MMRKITFLLTCLSFSFLCPGQQVTNSFINPGYGVLENNIFLTYSIGDLFYGEVSTPELYLTGMLYSGEKVKPTGITEVFQRGISIYPNPCPSILFVDTQIPGPLVFRLSAISGITLVQETILENKSIDLSDLPEGVYIIQMSDPSLNFYFSRKLIKSHRP